MPYVPKRIKDKKKKNKIIAMDEENDAQMHKAWYGSQRYTSTIGSH